MANNEYYLIDFSLLCERPLSNQGKLFEQRSRVILSLSAKWLNKKVKAVGFRKVNFFVNSKNNLQHRVILGNTCSYNVNMDLEAFTEMPVRLQKIVMLDFCIKILTKFFEDFDLDFKQLEGLQKFVEMNNFSNAFLGKETRIGHTKYYTICTQGFTKTKCHLIAKTRVKECRYFLEYTSTEEFVFQLCLKQPTLLNEGTLEVFLSDGKTHGIKLSELR